MASTGGPLPPGPAKRRAVLAASFDLRWTLVGEENGFTATNLPYQEFPRFEGVLPPGFDPETDPLPASGSWALSPPLGAPSGPDVSVDLHVRELAGGPSATGLRLRSEKDGTETVLTFYIGDPDLNDRFVYRRCGTTCPTATPSP